MNTVKLIGEALKELGEDLGRRNSVDNGFNKMAGIETGFTDLDRVTSGMRPGSLIVIASRPSMGKTTFALNIASHVSVNSKLPVLMFSMDHSSIGIASRLASQIGEIEMYKLRTGEMDESDKVKLNFAFEKLMDAPLYIDETPAQSIHEIINKSREVISNNGRLGLIVIDNLQLMMFMNEEDNKPEEVTNVMSSLNSLARETDTPIIILSQLNQKLEMRRNKRPRISDLPDRMIGQYSDLLMFLYRDEVYEPDSQSQGTAEIIIGRHRYGSIGMIALGSVKLKFGEFSNFESIHAASKQ